MAKFITQLRHGTTSDWLKSTVIPAKNELIVEYCDNGKKRFKLGNGQSKFEELPYIDSELETEISTLRNQVSNIVASDTGVTELEISDMRFGHDGTTYESAGEHIRSVGRETTDLKDSLEQFIGASAVDGLRYENNMLQLVAGGRPVGDPVEVLSGTGTGEGSATYVVRLSTSMPATKFSTAIGSTTTLTVRYSEQFGGESTNSNGELLVLYRQKETDPWLTWAKGSRTISQDVDHPIDITELIDQEKLYVRIQVTGIESQIAKYITFEITPVDVKFDTNFDTTKTYTGRVPVTCYFQGKNVEKILCVEIDGTLVAEEPVGTLHNDTHPYTIDMTSYNYGAHDLAMYFVTPEGARSEVKKYTLLYNNGFSNDPLIGVIQYSDKVTYGSPYKLDLVVDTPEKEKTSVNIQVYTLDNGKEVVYHTQELKDIADNRLTPWKCSNYPQEGTVFIKFTSGTAVPKLIEFTVTPYVNEQGYTVTPVSSDLVYHYSSVGKTNNDKERDTYTYQYEDSNKTLTQIKAVNTGINWAAQGCGYVNTDEGTALRLSGDARQTIKLPIFSTSYVDDDGQTVTLEPAENSTVTTRGRTIEFEYKVSNVTDPQAEIIRCMSANHAGFVITPQTCYLLSSDGADVDIDSSGFIENEDVIPAAYLMENRRLRVAFVIEAEGSLTYEDNGQTIFAQCVNIYINGQYANSVPYSANATFGQSEYITIGDSSCILDLYDVRIYNTALTTSEILRNYNTSHPELSERLLRISDNDVLNLDGDVDYELARKKYPCLLATGPLAPYKLEDSKYKCGWTLTLPDETATGFVTEFELLDKNDSGEYVSENNVQGTSSVKFPIKNYKVYLKKRVNNDDGSFKKAEKVAYSLKGKDADGNPLSIEESTLCWKGDFMSSDHANTFNANMADGLFTDTLDSQNPEKGGDKRVQNTIYGFRCLLFQRDDENSIPVFAGDGALNNDKGNTKTFGLEHEDDIVENNEEKTLTMPVTRKQKWEFRNNTEAICSFQSDRFFQTDNKGNKVVKAALESCYPDEGDLEDEGLEPDYRPLQTFYTWVCQRANFITASKDKLDEPLVYNGVAYDTLYDYKKAIFIREFDRHMNKHHAIIYYLFCEFVALADNRAKNMFLRSEDIQREKLFNTEGTEISIMDAVTPVTGEVNADMIDWENSEFAIWITDLYDLDSGFGVENTGKLLIPYYADWWHEVDNIQLFNGRDSYFWMMVEDAFAEDIKKTAQELSEKAATQGGLNYEALYHYHIENNAKLMCASVVNRDMEYKYNDSWRNGYIDYEQPSHPLIRSSQYKYLQRGSRTEQKDNFIYRRSNMLYSKYLCPKFINQTACISFRCGKEGGVVARDSGVTITTAQVLYPAVKFGDGDAAIVQGEKTFEGVPVTITKPGLEDADRVGNSDTVYIGGGSLITDIGDISKFHPDELRLEKATGLTQLILGSEADGYSNAKLTKVDTSYCKLLQNLNISGCTALPEVDLSQNVLIKKVIAKNTNTLVKLPDGGVLEELHLGNVTKLEVLNHSKLTKFSCGYQNLMSLRVENTPSIPVMDILVKQHNKLTNGIRLVGINETVTDTSLLKLLIDDSMRGKFIDHEGKFLQGDTRYPHISGTITVNIPEDAEQLDATLLAQVQDAYPELTINYNRLYCLVTFIGASTTPITQKIIHVTDPTDENYGKNNAECPVLSNSESYVSITTPVKSSDAQYMYKWGGWSEAVDGDPDPDVLLNITSNKTVYVAFIKTVIEYSIEFYNDNILLGTISTPYGKTVTAQDLLDHNIDCDSLEKSDTAYPERYEFRSWDPKPENISGPMKCYAQFQIVEENGWHTLGLADFVKSFDSTNKTLSITAYNALHPLIKVPETFTVEGANYSTTSVAGFNQSVVELVDLPNTLQTISANTFSDCTQLSEIDIPTSVNYIGSRAFYNCTTLDKVNYNAVEATAGTYNGYISQGPFNGCVSSKGFVVRIGNKVKVIPASMFSQGNTSENTVIRIEFEDTPVCAEIGEYAFARVSLEKLELPSSIKKIKSYAFRNNSKITELVLPEGLTTLGDSVFVEWKRLKKVRIPSTVSSIGSSLFASCPELETITVDGNNDQYVSIDNCLIDKVSKKLIQGCKKSIIPESVTSFASSAFKGCTNLADVVVPSIVSEIPSECFYECSNLESIDFRGNVTDIRAQAFYSCYNLNINLPSSVTSIGTNAFSYNKVTETVTMPSKLTNIGSKAFSSCEKLTTVDFRNVDALPTISDDAFASCSALTEIIVPWKENEVVGAPWGATNATIKYTS